MPQFTKVFPSIFEIGNSFTIPAGLAAFDDLTSGAAISSLTQWPDFPGCFGRQSANGAISSIRITANNAASQDHEILGVLPGPVVNQRGKILCRSPASFTAAPTGTVSAYLWGDGRLYVERVTTGNATATVGSIDLSALGRAQRPILCRLNVTGGASATRVRCKAWSFQQAEPASWDIDSTLSVTLNADGFPVLGRTAMNQPAFLGMAFSVGTEGDSAPDLTGLISGNVQVNGVAQSGRTVRAIAREDPGYTWDAVSAGDGAFSLRVLRGFTYTVVGLDELVGNFNAVVFDKIVPV